MSHRVSSFVRQGQYRPPPGLFRRAPKLAVSEIPWQPSCFDLVSHAIGANRICVLLGVISQLPGERSAEQIFSEVADRVISGADDPSAAKLLCRINPEGEEFIDGQLSEIHRNIFRISIA
jgi:hypothetical protein